MLGPWDHPDPSAYDALTAAKSGMVNSPSTRIARRAGWDRAVAGARRFKRQSALGTACGGCQARAAQVPPAEPTAGESGEVSRRPQAGPSRGFSA